MPARLFTILLILLLVAVAEAQVWTETSQWSSKAEANYQAWVRNNWRVDFFSRKTLPNGRANPFYGLRADCADVVYSMRAIYAYEYKLPFAVNDATGSGSLISNRMTRFNSISNPDQRARQFLAFLFDVVSTANMPRDTFPIAINRSWVRPGTMILTTKVNHHSWSVKDILPIGVPWLVFNSVVSATSSLVWQQRQSWPNPLWVFEGNQTPAGSAGFRAFRPLSHLRRSVWEVPGYSEEQYRIPLSQFQKTATARLSTQRESDDQLMGRLMKVSCQEAASRIGAVRDGVLKLRSTTGCYTYATYDNYSTPSRDERVFDALATLRVSYRQILMKNQGANISNTTKRQLKKIFPLIHKSAREETAVMQPQGVNDASVCTITYDSGKTIDLAEVKRRFFAGLTSSNPLNEMAYRWGEKRGISARAAACESWDPWVPNLNRAN